MGKEKKKVSFSIFKKDGSNICSESGLSPRYVDSNALEISYEILSLLPSEFCTFIYSSSLMIIITFRVNIRKAGLTQLTLASILLSLMIYHALF